MQQVTEQIRNFLQFVTLQFIKHPAEAQLRVAEVSENHVRFRLILNQEDVATLIGRNGFTASAIRNVLKAAAIREGIHATLQIFSHAEEERRNSAIAAGDLLEDQAPDDIDLLEHDDDELTDE